MNELLKSNLSNVFLFVCWDYPGSPRLADIYKLDPFFWLVNLQYLCHLSMASLPKRKKTLRWRFVGRKLSIFILRFFLFMKFYSPRNHQVHDLPVAMSRHGWYSNQEGACELYCRKFHHFDIEILDRSPHTWKKKTTIR